LLPGLSGGFNGFNKEILFMKKVCAVWMLTGCLYAAFAEKIQLSATPETGGEPGLVCRLSFEAGAAQNRQTADARVYLPVAVSGDGMTPSMKLYALQGDGTEKYLAAATIKPTHSAVNFIITGYFNQHAGQPGFSFVIRQTESPAPAVRPKPGAKAQLMVDTTEQPLYTPTEMMMPVWESSPVIWETVLPVSVDGNPAEAALLFEPVGGITVRDYALGKTFRNGVDFILKGNTIQLTENSPIPFLTRKQLYPDSADAPPKTFKSWKGGYVAFTEGNYWNDRQLAVSYEHAGKWDGPLPSSGKKQLLKTGKALRNGDPLKVLLLGDSISTGASASGKAGKPPFVPGFGDLLTDHLRAGSKSEITFVNASLGGMVSRWGAEVAPYYAAPEKPDLCLLGFGMNDGGGVPVAQYIANTEKTMELIRAQNPDVEFILIASFLPNENWRSLSPMNGYLDALKALESKTVAVADVWSMHEYFLKTKRYCDMTGNHVNHPNDFMVRVYAQVIAALLDK
jgi:lysophospholipase L1-like esterase